jgi:hypothetical protein
MVYQARSVARMRSISGVASKGSRLGIVLGGLAEAWFGARSSQTAARGLPLGLSRTRARGAG